MTTPSVVPDYPDNPYYAVLPIPSKGYGCIAKTALKRGTRILADTPLLTVPMANYLSTDISTAFALLTPSQQTLYHTLASAHAQDPTHWPSTIHPSLTGRARQRTAEQHAARTAPIASLVSIFQTNCMEVGKGAGVFPLAARFNHSCSPNACFSWNAAIGRETIHAMCDIEPGKEITLCYCDGVHDRVLRAWELKHYGFRCGCVACVDVEANGDGDGDGDGDGEESWAQMSAGRRFRLQELEGETRGLRGGRLGVGARERGFVGRLVEMADLHMREGDYSARLASVFLDIALVCEVNDDLKNAEAAAVRAVEVKRDCQGDDYPDFDKYVEVLHRVGLEQAMLKA